LAKIPGADGDLFGRRRCEFGGTIAAKEFPRGVARFCNSVGDQRELIRQSEPEARFCVCGRFCDTKREAVLTGYFRAVDVGRDVARIGDGQRVVRVRTEDEAGRETSIAAADHASIHCDECFRGTLGGESQRTHGSDEKRYGHGGWQAFAADVTDDDKDRASIAPSFDWNDLKKVATNLTEGLVDAADREAGDIRVPCGPSCGLCGP